MKEVKYKCLQNCCAPDNWFIKWSHPLSLKKKAHIATELCRFATLSFPTFPTINTIFISITSPLSLHSAAPAASETAGGREAAGWGPGSPQRTEAAVWREAQRPWAAISRPPAQAVTCRGTGTRSPSAQEIKTESIFKCYWCLKCKCTDSNVY